MGEQSNKDGSITVAVPLLFSVESIYIKTFSPGKGKIKDSGFESFWVIFYRVRQVE
jgi:hypothetical protein